MLVDAVFLIANLMKVSGGGWVTIAIAVVVVTLMLTWRAGSRVLLQRTRAAEMPLVALLDDLKQAPPQTVQGTAVFLTSHPDRAPAALLHTLKHFRVLHRTLVLLSVRTADKPHVPIEQGVTIRPITPDVIVIELSFGFMDSPNIPRALGVCRKLGWRFDIMSTSFFLSRRSLKADKPSAMALWRTHLFITLANNAVDATEYFRIPKDRVVEVGTQVGI
jgi:KUP system potassium uptake protein